MVARSPVETPRVQGGVNPPSVEGKLNLPGVEGSYIFPGEKVEWPLNGVAGSGTPSRGSR